MKHAALALCLLASTVAAQSFDEAKKDFMEGRFSVALSKARRVPERDANLARARYLRRRDRADAR